MGACLLAGLCFLVLGSVAHAGPREVDLKLPIGGRPGPLDAITDVAGVEVGQVTLIKGKGKLIEGRGPVRTGVTIVFPRGRDNTDPVMGAWSALNGNGELTGTTWLQESGFLEGPIGITNTHSVGVVHDSIIKWELARKQTLQPWWLPVVGETYDGILNDVNGFHVTEADARVALDSARGGPVQEGVVGGGTGMICFGFKGGTGTASRRLEASQGGYTVGVLVQCNYGVRKDLRIAGVPVGERIPDQTVCDTNPQHRSRWELPLCDDIRPPDGAKREQGSIIVIVATDAPLLPTQLKRLATRVAIGVGREGGFGGNSSGDIFLAFSTANAGAWRPQSVHAVNMIGNAAMSPLFEATAQATEAAVTNALLAATTTEGADGVRAYAMPVNRMLGIMAAARAGTPAVPAAK